MNIHCISDTHALHRQLIIPEGIDLIIHAGDATNYRELYKNEIEFEDFLDWYSKLDIEFKILIAGNHCAWATKNYNKEKVKEAGIIYLEHEFVTINGIKIFGSPYTPTFGSWYFNVDRSKLDKYWKVLKDDIDILVTHGPPYGVLDLAHDYGNKAELCGDKRLLNHVNRIKPKYHIYGHTHSNPQFENQGIVIRNDIQFMNVSCVTDSEFDKGVSSHGITIQL